MHDSSTLPSLFLPTQAGYPFLQVWLKWKCYSLSIFSEHLRLLPGCSDCALLDELMKILVEFSLIFETEGDILAPLGNLVDRQDLPPPQQLLDPFGLGMHCS